MAITSVSSGLKPDLINIDKATQTGLRNNGLHGIEIITYDQVVARAKRLVEIFSPVIEK